MISGRDFVVVSDDWYGLPTSAIHLFRLLARQNRVFWFNTISRMPKFTRADVGHIAKTLKKWSPKFARVQAPPRQRDPASVHVANPFMVPWFKAPGRRFNRASFLAKYHKLRDRHAIKDPILLTTVPYAVDFFKCMPDGVQVYYCVDDFLDYPGVNHADWRVMEEQLLDNVDGIIITSRILREKCSTACPLLYLPHGVDFEHFNRGLSATIKVPSLEKLTGPIVGFFGLISAWIDLALIADLSKEFPNVSFVLLGRQDVGLNAVAGRPNVHYLGLVPYGELPGYARYFTIGIIPFVLSKLTRAVNPLKLLEYFSLGLPVLSTRLPELEACEGPLRLAATRAEFSASLAEMLAGAPDLTAERAIAAARLNTWEMRAGQLSDFLESVDAARK